jgi:hypothetical protein
MALSAALAALDSIPALTTSIALKNDSSSLLSESKKIIWAEKASEWESTSRLSIETQCAALEDKEEGTFTEPQELYWLRSLELWMDNLKDDNSDLMIDALRIKPNKDLTILLLMDPSIMIDVKKTLGMSRLIHYKFYNHVFHYSCVNGWVDLVERLVTKMAVNPNRGSNMGLMTAIYEHRTDVVAYLIKLPSVYEKLDSRILSHAALRDDVVIFELLFNHPVLRNLYNTNLEARLKIGRTAGPHVANYLMRNYPK